MKTETFEIQSVAEETAEQSAEALALIESLGLKGQQPKTASTTVTRCPYRLLTKEEGFVYQHLCPEACAVEEYAAGPIPIEVLKCLAYAKTFPEFGYFEVWAAESARVKDPILVARKDRWSGNNYLLARWGDELMPIEVLLPDALKKWWAKRQESIRNIINDCEKALNRGAPASLPKTTEVPVAYHLEP